MSNQPSPWGNFQVAPTGTSRFQPQPEPVNELAYRSLGLGIGSILLMVCGIIATVMGVFAIINGWQAMQMTNPTGKVLGTIGLVCGGIGVLGSVGLSILYTFLAVAFD